jgi:hypothetical protein
MMLCSVCRKNYLKTYKSDIENKLLKNDYKYILRHFWIIVLYLVYPHANKLQQCFSEHCDYYLIENMYDIRRALKKTCIIVPLTTLIYVYFILIYKYKIEYIIILLIAELITAICEFYLMLVNSKTTEYHIWFAKRLNILSMEYSIKQKFGEKNTYSYNNAKKIFDTNRNSLFGLLRIMNAFEFHINLCNNIDISDTMLC